MCEDLMQNSVSTNLIASGFVVHYTAYMRTPFDVQHPQRQCFLSLLLLEVLGKDIWHLSCVLKLYKDDTAVLVKHAISMLRVRHLTHGNWFLTNHVAHSYRSSSDIQCWSHPWLQLLQK